MRRLSINVLLSLTVLVGLLPGAASSVAAEEGTASPNVSHIKNLPYELQHGQTKSYGTDIEFASFGKREYALAGSYDNGLQIIDITNPANASIAAVYDCGVLQGDVQVFKQGRKTFATYTAENSSSIKVESRCVRELAPEATAANKIPAYGTYIIDISNPRDPRSAGFIPVREGSHNGSVHPSGNFFYNSNSALYTDTVTLSGGQPGIEVYDISDVANPERVTKLNLPFVPASLGTESHDITFADDGDRAYSAALSQGVVIDTTDPAAPTIISSIVDPSINVWHQADPVTLTAEDGTEREFLIAEDEYAGAAGGPHCPSGGVHVYEITGAMEANPSKVGYWNIDDMRLTSPTGRCTAHVFDIHEDEGIMTMAFYNGGIRVVDLQGLAGIALGDTPVAGSPMVEIGSYYFPNSDTWAVKTNKIQRDGDFYLYSNDVNRGLDIFAFDAEDSAPPAKNKNKDKGKTSARDSGGQWLSAAQAAATLPRLAAPAFYEPFCLLSDKA